MSDTSMYLLAAIGWLGLFGGIRALMRSSARRHKAAQERAFQDWLRRGWKR